MNQIKNDQIWVRCPECGELSNSIKNYKLPNYIVFLLLGATGQTISYICCPHCMRKHILIKCFTYNILLANVLWPFLIVPWGIVQLIRSYTKGHSDSVMQIIQSEINRNKYNE